MKLVMVAIYDSAGENYKPPMFYPARGAATRDFMDAVNDKTKDNQLYYHADDFTLYEIGEYETLTGKITQKETHEQIIRAKDIKQMTQTAETNNNTNTKQ